MRTACGHTAAISVCKRSARALARLSEVDGGLDLRVLGAIEIAPCGRPGRDRGFEAASGARGVGRSSRVGGVDGAVVRRVVGRRRPARSGGGAAEPRSRLRRILAPGGRDRAQRPPGYVLQIPDDMRRRGTFRVVVQAATRSSSDPSAVVESLEAAFGMLAGIVHSKSSPTHDWGRRESVRLDELRVGRTGRICSKRALALGEHAVLVGELEAHVAERPLRERAWLQLILALYRSGHAAGGAAAADTFRNAIARRARARAVAGVAGAGDAGPHRGSRPASADGARHAPTRGARLPVEATRLVGPPMRSNGLAGRVRRDRLVTLTGPGGVGKTAWRCAWRPRMWEELGGEVFVAELAPVHDPGVGGAAAIATAVDMQQRQHLSVAETLVEYLRARRRTLLVLDNCEHLRRHRRLVRGTAAAVGAPT